ncbi:MAG TPA: cytochrome b [Xanthobacteraceae bacterium]|jgi:cytochrome b561
MNDPRRGWPLPVRLFHWLGAVLVLWTLALGTYMVQFVDDAARRFELTQTHKSIGIAILGVTIIRLFLRLVTVAPKPELAARLTVLAAKLAHWALYALLVVMPASGWLMISTTPVRVPTVVFGLFRLPYPLAPNVPLYRLAHAIHLASAIALAALIAVHVAAALIHALLWRDQTLARMFWRPSTSGQPAPVD